MEKKITYQKNSFFKSWLVLAFIVFCIQPISSQRRFKKSKLKKNEKLIVRNDGIQWSLGPTFLLTNRKNETQDFNDNNGTRGNYLMDPSGKLGFFVEAGMAHFPKWTPIFRNRLLDYVDWGVGFKSLSGKEKTTINYTNSLNEVISTDEGIGNFRNGFLSFRFSAHTLIYFGKTENDLKAKKYFIDNAIGFNFDLNLWRGNKEYVGFSMPETQKFHSPSVLQLHYNLALGIRINRALICLPGIQLPILGLYEWNGWGANMNWFSSKYWPIQLNIKFIRLLEKKPTCAPVYNNPMERQKMRELME